jgi:hypothetical protein
MTGEVISEPAFQLRNIQNALTPTPDWSGFRLTGTSRGTREASGGFNWRLVAVILFVMSVF